MKRAVNSQPMVGASANTGLVTAASQHFGDRGGGFGDALDGADRRRGRTERRHEVDRQQCVDHL